MQTVKIHFRFAAARVVNKTNIQHQNDRKRAASCEATLQVLLHVTILKRALGLERVRVLTSHFSRTLQIFKAASYDPEPTGSFCVGSFLCGFLHPHTALLTSAGFSVGAEMCQHCTQPWWIWQQEGCGRAASVKTGWLQVARSKGKAGSHAVSRAEMPRGAARALHCCACEEPLQLSKSGVLSQFCPPLVHATKLMSQDGSLSGKDLLTGQIGGLPRAIPSEGGIKD